MNLKLKYIGIIVSEPQKIEPVRCYPSYFATAAHFPCHMYMYICKRIHKYMH